MRSAGHEHLRIKGISVGEDKGDGEMRGRWDLRQMTMTVLFFVALLLSGCSDGRHALAPPDADVSGIQKVIVFPFANETGQRQLEQHIVDGLIARLQHIGWYEVIGPARIADSLATRRIDVQDVAPFETTWLETARDIAMELGADGFVVGQLSAYDEDVTLSSPFRRNADPKEDATSFGQNLTELTPPTETEWVVDQKTTVSVIVTGKLINVHTGETVYERKVQGESVVYDERPLNWTLAAPPPEDLIPAPHRRDLSAARENAVLAALDEFTKAILPRPAEVGDE